MSAFDSTVKKISELIGISATGRTAASGALPVALADEDSALLTSLGGPQFLTVVSRIAGDDGSHQLIGTGADVGVPTDYPVASDTIVSAASPGDNYGVTTQLIVGLRSTGARRALVKADFSGLSGKVSRASLFLYHKDDAIMLANQNVQAHRILAANDWVEGAKNGATGTGTDCTWNKRSITPDGDWAGSAGLSTSGTDYDATMMGDGLILDGVPGWYEIELDATEFAEMVAANYGLLLIGEYAVNDRIAYFHSSEYATANLRPYFRVWTPAASSDARSVYLVADAPGATWSNGDTATEDDAPVPTGGITVPAVTDGDVILSVYVPTGVNVWWAAIG